MGNRQTENWKDIPGYEGRYEVSDLGRVRHAVTGRVRKPQKTRRGELIVTVADEAYKKKWKNIIVHRAVSMAFLGVTSREENVTHLDLNRNNNAATNLKVTSFSEIMKGAVKRGRVPLIQRGEMHWQAKLTAAEAREIRALAGMASVTEIAQRFGISRSTAYSVLTMKTWRHI